MRSMTENTLSPSGSPLESATAPGPAVISKDNAGISKDNAGISKDNAGISKDNAGISKDNAGADGRLPAAMIPTAMIPVMLPAVGAQRLTVALADLRVGQRGTLGDWSFEPRDAEYLRALGLTPGSELRVCKQGEPCIVQVQRTRLGLARSVARRVFASLDPPAAQPLSAAGRP